MAKVYEGPVTTRRGTILVDDTDRGNTESDSITGAIITAIIVILALALLIWLGTMFIRGVFGNNSNLPNTNTQVQQPAKY
jgi:hypothetical protein